MPGTCHGIRQQFFVPFGWRRGNRVSWRIEDSFESRHRPVEFVDLRLFCSEDKLGTLRSKPDGGWRGQSGIGDLLTIQVCPVGAFKVANPKAVPLAANLQMLQRNTGDIGTLNHQIVLRASSYARDAVA